MEAVKGILEKTPQELDQIGISSAQYPDLYEAKNSFYEVCLIDDQIEGVGFSKAPDFPIPRSAFGEHITLLPNKPADEKIEWTWGELVVLVTSPNWDKDDRSRLWKGRYGTGKVIFFEISDENFWAQVQADDIPTHVIDEIKIQAVFQAANGRPKEAHAVRILSYNKQMVSHPYSDHEMLSIIEEHYKSAHSVTKEDLFTHSSE